MSDDTTNEIKEIGAKVVAEWIAEMDSKGLPGEAMYKDALDMVSKQSQ